MLKINKLWIIISLSLLFLFSNCEEDQNITDADFIGKWSVVSKVEGYNDDNSEPDFINSSSDVKLQFNANGEGSFTNDGETKSTEWIYVPTRERMYIYVKEDSIGGGSISFIVNEVQNNSQLWTDEAYFEPYRYVYTWELERE